MPRISFTSHLERHLSCPPAEVTGTTVRAVLEEVFASNSQLRGYLLDDQGTLRQHVIIFLDGEAIRDRIAQSDMVRADSEIYVLQALSGG